MTENGVRVTYFYNEGFALPESEMALCKADRILVDSANELCLLVKMSEIFHFLFAKNTSVTAGIIIILFVWTVQFDFIQLPRRSQRHQVVSTADKCAQPVVAWWKLTHF